ncbi:hypothetical protein WJX73_010789 [Symbiochloris irregularis]|uniref:Uncharacterized protein n=1 Tax=Symbiochloris irregularis TaxID=706552 RepID=A0AAW1PEZ0_9CHLO
MQPSHTTDAAKLAVYQALWQATPLAHSVAASVIDTETGSVWTGDTFGSIVRWEGNSSREQEQDSDHTKLCASLLLTGHSAKVHVLALCKGSGVQAACVLVSLSEDGTACRHQVCQRPAAAWLTQILGLPLSLAMGCWPWKPQAPLLGAWSHAPYWSALDACTSLRGMHVEQ